MNRYDRKIVALALPALGALAADPLVSMIDTVFVGRLGVVELAALGVNTSVFAFAFILFNFLAYGTTPMIARAIGRGDRARAGELVIQALVLAGSVGVLAAIILALLAEPIVAVMGATGELVTPALTYLRIRALAGPAVLFVTAGHGIFRGYHDTRTPLKFTLALNLVNLILDPLLIFGFGWGLAGAAWATVAAQWTGAVWCLWLLLVGRREAMGIRLFLPRLADLVPFLRIGGQLALRTFALIGAMTLATAVATRVGTMAVAAHQVASQLWIFLALSVDALAIAAQAMVAGHRGAGEATDARGAANRLLAWGLGVGVLLSLVLWALSPYLPRLFTDNAEVLAAVAAVMPFIVWMQPLNAIVFVLDGIFLGAERFRYLAAQMTASALVAAGMLLLVIPRGWGLTGVWWGLVALMVTRIATLLAGYFGARSCDRLTT